MIGMRPKHATSKQRSGRVEINAFMPCFDRHGSLAQAFPVWYPHLALKAINLPQSSFYGIALFFPCTAGGSLGASQDPQWHRPYAEALLDRPDPSPPLTQTPPHTLSLGAHSPRSIPLLSTPSPSLPSPCKPPLPHPCADCVGDSG